MKKRWPKIVQDWIDDAGEFDNYEEPDEAELLSSAYGQEDYAEETGDDFDYDFDVEDL